MRPSVSIKLWKFSNLQVHHESFLGLSMCRGWYNKLVMAKQLHKDVSKNVFNQRPLIKQILLWVIKFQLTYRTCPIMQMSPSKLKMNSREYRLGEQFFCFSKVQILSIYFQALEKKQVLLKTIQFQFNFGKKIITML